MLKGPWVMGEQLHDLRSLSLYARSLARRRQRRCLDACRRCWRIVKRMAERPAVQEGPCGREALRQIRSRPGLAPGRRMELLRGLAVRLIHLAAGFQHQLAQPDRAGIHLGAGRIEHELLVDPGIERWRHRHQRQLLRQRARSGGAARRRRDRCGRRRAAPRYSPAPPARSAARCPLSAASHRSNPRSGRG